MLQETKREVTCGEEECVLDPRVLCFLFFSEKMFDDGEPFDLNSRIDHSVQARFFYSVIYNTF